ncbi:MAG: tetratricopeptide repeat protein [Minicystis sp.]
MDADALHARALDLLVEGDTAGGITDLRAYLAARPDDAAAWLSLGTAYAVIDHAAQAVEALRRAVDLDGGRADARLAYARALVRIGALDDAAVQLEEAARIDPADARVIKELGIARYDQRRYDEAAALLARAVAVAPEDARGHYALGVVHEARRDMAAAVAAYRAAIARDPRLTDARRTLADALASLGEHEAAVAELEAVLAVDRTDEQAVRNRDVLRRALAEMRRKRLLGRGAEALQQSALITEGGFRNKGAAGERTVRYAAPLVEVYATFDEADALDALLLVLTDPDRAARTEDDVFKVTVIARDGRSVPADTGTALTLTFLREALGCPLTTASAVYARLLGGEAEVEQGGAVVAWGSAPRLGIQARRRDR